MKTTRVNYFFRLLAIGVMSLLGVLNTNCSGNSKGDTTLKIAVSADMRFTMDSIVERFEKKSSIKCEVISGSSGILATQIKKGAPYDLYFSANEQFTKDLYINKLSEKPLTFAKGQLVFVYTGNKRFSSVKEAITDQQVHRIGQADEIGAPYGRATSDFINKQELNDLYQPKKVVGESIEQVNHFLESGAVDAIFTSYSFVVKNKQKYPFLVVDPGLYPEIRQSSVVLSRGGKSPSEATKTFMKFFQSAESKAIITHFGYLATE